MIEEREIRKLYDKLAKDMTEGWETFLRGYKEGVKKIANDFTDKQIKYSEMIDKIVIKKLALQKENLLLNKKIEQLEKDLMHAQAAADNGVES